MKFKALYESILHENRRLYRVSSDGTKNIIWKRKGGNLEGAPEETLAAFNCANVQLQSLEGGPKKVKGYFNCSRNHLKDLKGAPKIVGGNFYCSSSGLQSLEGAPEEIKGNFLCYNNPLQSLKHIPKADFYELPDGFTLKDVNKELERRKFEKDLDKDTRDTFGDFIGEL